MEVGNLDYLAINSVIIRDISGYDLQQIVDVSAHSIEFQHLRNLGNTFRQTIKPLFAMLGGADRHDHRHAEAQWLAVENGDTAIDDACLFQAFDSLPAGSGGETYAFPDDSNGDRRILL